MKKLGVFILFIILAPLVYSISFFDQDLTSNLELEEVRNSNEIIELLVTNNNNKQINGLIINLDGKISNINTNINPYETKLITIYFKENPNKLIINSYYNFNHRLINNNDNLQYTFSGNEQPIINQPEQIIVQENQQLQLQFNNNPSYVSYSSYSKLDDNKNIIYFTKDHISSNRISTNNQGNIEFQANYMPYGEIFKETGQESYKFSNKELDSSNLYYFGARYYDSNIARFTQVDPIFKSSESPYMYANNNPIKYTDPTGKASGNYMNSRFTPLSDVENEFGMATANTKIPSYEEFVRDYPTTKRAAYVYSGFGFRLFPSKTISDTAMNVLRSPPFMECQCADAQVLINAEYQMKYTNDAVFEINNELYRFSEWSKKPESQAFGNNFQGFLRFLSNKLYSISLRESLELVPSAWHLKAGDVIVLREPASPSDFHTMGVKEIRSNWRFARTGEFYEESREIWLFEGNTPARDIAVKSEPLSPEKIQRRVNQGSYWLGRFPEPEHGN